MAVRVGVIGAGTFGTVHLRVYKQQLEPAGKVKLVAFSDMVPEILEKQQKAFDVKGYADYHKMLAEQELDAVSVVTPDPYHEQPCIDVANSGRHVLVEKPLATSVAGCDRIIEAAKKSNVLLQVDFHKRFDPDHQELERIIQEGKLGTIQYGHVHMEEQILVPTVWFKKWAHLSSSSWYLGVHFYDVVRWQLKSNARRVYAKGHKGKLLNEYGIDAYDSIQALVEFENGTTVCFDTSWILPNGFEALTNQYLRMLGTKGMWEADSQNRGVEACYEEEGQKTHNVHFLREYRDKQGRMRLYGYGVDSIVDFIDNVIALKNGATLKDLEGKYPSGEDGREVSRIAEAVDKSIATGQVIEL